MTKINNIAF